MKVANHRLLAIPRLNLVLRRPAPPRFPLTSEDLAPTLLHKKPQHAPNSWLAPHVRAEGLQHRQPDIYLYVDCRFLGFKLRVPSIIKSESPPSAATQRSI